jgi:hypothetical protein
MWSKVYRQARLIGWTGALLVLAALYLGTAARVGMLRWDGFGPVPYRYVVAPPGIQNGGSPAPVSGTVPFRGGVSQASQFYTPDLQAQVLIPTGAFPPSASGQPVVVSINPRAPPVLTPLFAYGNAYLIMAAYYQGEPVPTPWKQTIMVVLRYPDNVSPLGLYRLDAGNPTSIGSSVDQSAMTAPGMTDRGGTFVVAGASPPMLSPALVVNWPARLLPTAIATVLLAGGGLLVLSIRKRRKTPLT